MKKLVIAGVLLIGCLMPIRADLINIGALSFDQFIPPDVDVPGVNAFNVINLTGPLNFLPPDFPVADDLVFQNATLTVFYEGGGTLTIPLPFLAPDTDNFTSAEFDATLAPLSFLVDGALVVATSSKIHAVLTPANDILAIGESALISIDVEPAVSAVPEPVDTGLLLFFIIACGYLRRKNAHIAAWLVLATLAVHDPARAQSPTQVTLAATTTPTEAQPGVTTVTITGSGFPSGTIPPNLVVVTFTPVTTGPTMSATASDVTTITGTTRRVTFHFTGANVAAPIAYDVGVSGANFVSKNKSRITINPPAAVTLNPTTGNPGAQAPIAITGKFTNFVNGSTSANFGPGITVGTAAAGTFGKITVTSLTTATAQVSIDPTAVGGPRQITVATGLQQASATFNVGTNHAPVSNAGPDQNVLLNSIATLNGAASSDPDKDPLTFHWTLLSKPAGSIATLTGATTVGPTLPIDKVGQYLAQLIVNDGHADSAPDQVLITAPANGPPQLVTIRNLTLPLGSTLEMRLAATDPDPQDKLAFSLTSGPTGAALNPTPIVKWTPTAAQLGTSNFSVRVDDNSGHFDAKTFSVNVTNTNLKPAFNPQPDETINLGTTFLRTLVAQDPNAGSTLTYSLVSGPTGMSLSPAHQLSWTPAGTQLGAFPVKVQVTDAGGQTDVALFTITVANVLGPVAQNDSYEVALGQTLAVSAPGVLQNDISPGGVALTANKLTDPTKGTLSAFNTNGSFSYLAPPLLGPTFQPVVKTHFEFTNNLYTNPIVADLDGDGKAEIIALYLKSGILAIHENGSVFWSRTSFPAPNADCNVILVNPKYALAVGDLDGNGKPDIVVPIRCQRDSLQAGQLPASRYAALSGLDGSIKWISPPVSALTIPTGPNFSQFDLVQNTVPTIARLRAGETPSVLFEVSASGNATVAIDNSGNPVSGPACSHVVQTVPNGGYLGHYFSCRGVIVLNGADGTVRQRMIAPMDIATGDLGFESTGAPAPIVADLDRDGTQEIVAGSVVFNLDGSIKWHSQDKTAAETALGNFDDTPDIEIIRYESNKDNQALAVYKSNGTPLWRLPFDNQTEVSKLTVADVDGTGRPSIVLNLFSTVCAFDYRGNYKWCYNAAVGANPKISSRNRHAIFDLDGDGVPEVIVSAMDKLLFLDGSNGKLKFAFDVTSISSPSGLAPSTVNDSFETPAPVVADTDGDGHAKVVFTWVANNFEAATRVTILRAANNDWRPVRQIMNQAAYFVSNINDNGTVPTLPLANNFATPATNVFGTQPPIGAPVDPRKRSQTSFTYAAHAGGLSSAPATVSIDITPVNRPPVFTSTPPTRYFTGAPNFTYTAHAVDPDFGDTVTYSLVSNSQLGGICNINPASGVLTCNQITTSNAVILIAATDNLGEFTLQTLLMKGVTSSTLVPNVVGQPQAAASSILTAAGLATGVVTESVNGAPAGQVISQAPAANSSVLSGESIALTVSKGPMPVLVPNVVGAIEGSARTQLIALGFTPAVTRAFSNTIPEGEVLSQNPAAGAVVPPGAIALTVSAGNGLSLQLARSLTTADVAISFTVASFDLNGNAQTPPALNFVVSAALSPFAGTLPTVGGNQIVPGSATRGAFRITATDPATSRTVNADFAVTYPRVAGAASMMDGYAQLTQAMSDIDALIRQGKTALAANNAALVKSLLVQMVTRWRQVDIDALKFSTPLGLETGFAPTQAQLSQFGLSPTPDDLLIEEVLEDAAADLQAWTDGLLAQGTSITQLNALADQFGTRAARLHGLTVHEWGAVNSHSEYIVLASHRLPALYDALMSEVARAVGMAPASEPFPTLFKKRSTLGEVLATTAMQYLVDKMIGEFNQTYANAKQFATDVLTQAAYAGAALVIAQHIRAFVQGLDITGIVSGASLSFRVFQSPYSMIEGEIDTKNPDINTVITVGPDVLNPVAPFIQKFQDAMKYRKTLNPVANDGKYKNQDEIRNDLLGFRDALKGLLSGTQAVVDAVKNTFQTAKTAERTCLFSASGTCGELIYPDGFKSVYTYKPPEGFGSFTGLPLPIIFIVYNPVSGIMYFDTPPFFPTPGK